MIDSICSNRKIAKEGKRCLLIVQRSLWSRNKSLFLVESPCFLYYYITACESCNCFLLIDSVAEKSAPDLIQWNHCCKREMKLQERELCLQKGEKPSRADLQFISERESCIDLLSLLQFNSRDEGQLSRWILHLFCESCRSELEIRTRNEEHYLNIAITSSI